VTLLSGLVEHPQHQRLPLPSVLLGVIFPRASVRGRRSGSVTTGSRPTGPGTRFWRCYRSRPTPAARSTGGSQSTRPHRGFIRTVPPHRGPRAGPAPTQGAGSSYKDPPDRVTEPEDHAIGRSRGGLTTKTHALVDGNGMPLVIAVTPGQANDSRRCRSSLRSFGFPGSDLAVHGRLLRRCERTRPTQRVATGRSCAREESPR
jgi:putative transposase